jgi:hypothetical protein
MKIALLFFSLFLVSNHASGYVNFIGHGYTSCLNCHFNPFGGGPLNDYGRVVGATAISSRALYPANYDEEKIAYTSGFFFRKPKQDWLRTQINYRGFQVVRNFGTEAQSAQWINMQADGRLILKFGENDRFVAVGNYGYAPLPPNAPVENPVEWRSREHYLGFKINPNIGIYAGMMDKVYGLRVVEHNAFSRRTTLQDQNDQVHGAAVHFVSENWEGGVHYFVGNLVQREDLRMRGGSFMIERTVGDGHRLGVSAMSQENEYLGVFSSAMHSRFNLKDGAAVLAEVGQSQRRTANNSDDRTARYGLIQTYLRPGRGFYVLSNIEYLKNNTELDSYTVRWGPGIQYFPVQKVELRLDLYNTRNFSPDSSNRDTWMYLLQGHVWL